MTTFHGWISAAAPSLHLWRQGRPADTSVLQFDRLPTGLDDHGCHTFVAELDHQIHEPVGFTSCREQDGSAVWERPEHNRTLPRLAQYRFPEHVWFVAGAARVLADDPFAAAHEIVRVHVITARRYRGGRLYAWLPGLPPRVIDPAFEDADGIVFDVPMPGVQRHLCLFKMLTSDGRFEAETANRLWSARDGAEIWTHADTDAVVGEPPERRRLDVHLLQDPALGPPMLHLWGLASDYRVDLAGVDRGGGEYLFAAAGLFTGHGYGFLCVHGEDPDRRWEHAEATRRVTLSAGGDLEVWTLEGDHELYAAPPAIDRPVALTIVDAPPSSALADALGSNPSLRPRLDVWANHARGLLHRGLAADADGRYRFQTFPEIVTSFRFRTDDGRAEAVDRHTCKVPAAGASGELELFVVLDRAEPLMRAPSAPLFADPPDAGWIARPGAWQHDDRIRFAVHAPEASRVEVIGEWTGWQADPVHMQSTRDGAYWWAEVAVAAIGEDRLHGALYKFLIGGVREQQDPAADWVESSNPQQASRLVDHRRHRWQTLDWRPPGKEYLTVYQLHPRRFSQRFAEPGRSPLDQVAEEISRPDGYLRTLGITAILLMPVNEFAGDDSWGYNPAFFYAVETAYGGPDALKRLVDTCHEHGIAVILDVVFNHAGTSDNPLWSVARDSYFKGDTSWGALVNVGHPQAVHFFEENLRALVRHYHVDGFRFDHTWTIRYSDRVGAHVTVAGSSGGWEFLHRMRRAAHREQPGVLLMAEHLPNEWDLTNVGGPMDTQWCDDFHDRIEDACRGDAVMGRLADALAITHTASDDWYKATNYPESHDEVGNENDRLAQVGGFGQGLRRNKVAAAVTLCSRGIPMWFMGAEAGEHRQFLFNRNDVLDLDRYDSDLAARHVRAWWRALTDLRRGNPAITGPAPLQVHLAEQQWLVFSRGQGRDYVVIANFGGWSGWKPRHELRLPEGAYRERLNSTWQPYQVEGEDAHVNSSPSIGEQDWVHVPDYGVVVLERV